ncbi:MAG TPA: ATP-binding protein [Vicinamibacterales bacterium]
MPASPQPIDQRTLVAALSRAQSAADAAATISAAACALLGADAGAVFVREGDEAVRAVGAGSAPAADSLDASGTELAAWVTRHATPAVVADVQQDDSGLPLHALSLTPVRGVLVVPLPGDAGAPAGALAACWMRPHVSSADEVASFEQLAGVAALGLRIHELGREVETLRGTVQAQRRELDHRVAEFETLLDVIPVGIGIARDPLGNDIGTNRAFREMLRLSPDANASLSAPEPERPHHFRLQKDGRELPPDALPLQRAAREGVQINGLEVDLVFDDGSRRKLLEFASPLFDEHNRVRGSVGAFVDVTERAAAEERFRRLSDDAPMGIWITGPDHRTIWVNRVWIEFTGRPLEAHLGSGWAESVHPEDRQRVIEESRAAFRTQSPIEFELRVRRHDGVYRWMLSRGRPLYDNRQFIGYVGLIVDVTAQHDAALAERRAREEAERANHLKDEFLAILSHELRTPLNAIVGWTYLLREHRDSPELVRQALDTLERNARLQSRLIDDLLDMSRIVTGRVRLERERVELQGVIAAVADSVRPDAERKRVELVLDLDRRVPPILGDPARLQQVVWNLVANAVKFTNPGGTVSVSLTVAEGEAAITVRDTGSGIDPAFLPHMFERFRQADASTSRRHGGLGIGLSIARDLVELHGGEIRAESQGTGRGATFVVTLPIPPASRGDLMLAAGSDERSLPRFDGVSVLLVEDDLDSQRLFSLLLEQRGATVRSVSSAAAAVSALEEAVPDVLVSDIGLPGADGYELIRQIRARGGPFSRLPALALTAFARKNDRRRAVAAGFQMHLSKPVRPADLCGAIGRLIGAQASVRSSRRAHRSR